MRLADQVLEAYRAGQDSYARRDATNPYAYPSDRGYRPSVAEVQTARQWFRGYCAAFEAAEGRPFLAVRPLVASVAGNAARSK